MDNSKSITYVSNAGVLININNKKILIDGLCTSKIRMYKSTPVEIREKIINGISPFDNIDIMLITHQHSDHFDANLICSFFEKSPNTTVISTSKVISSIRSCMSNTRSINLVELNPLFHCSERIKINGVEIQAISMIHEGKDCVDVNNLAFLIEYGVKILHLGDAAPVKENFESLNLKQHKIDALIVNFPYVSIPRAREIIKNYTDTQKILVVHLPYKELDKFNWIRVAKKSYERNKDSFIQTIFMEEIGMVINL